MGILELQLILMWLWISTLESVPRSSRKLTFDENSCYGPFVPTPEKNFTVTHTATATSVICQDMSFHGRSDDVTREACVKLTKNSLYCSHTLEFRVGGVRERPVKSYGCSDPVRSVPAFCTSDLLYVRIKSDHDAPVKSSLAVYTVYCGQDHISSSSIDSGSSLSPLLIVFAVFGLLAAIIVPVCCVRLRKTRALESRDRQITYARNRQPQVHVHHHHYHPVNHCGEQNTTPTHNPHLGQLPLNYRATPKPSPSTQRHSPTTTSTPGVYPYTPEQCILSPYTSLSVHQQTDDMLRPTSSHEKVLIQKQ